MPSHQVRARWKSGKVICESNDTSTVSYTVTHCLKCNCIIINYLLADAADLKSADPKGLWGFKSPSRHHTFSGSHFRVSMTIDHVGNLTPMNCEPPKHIARVGYLQGSHPLRTRSKPTPYSSRARQLFCLTASPSVRPVAGPPSPNGCHRAWRSNTRQPSRAEKEANRGKLDSPAIFATGIAPPQILCS